MNDKPLLSHIIPYISINPLHPVLHPDLVAGRCNAASDGSPVVSRDVPTKRPGQGRCGASPQLGRLRTIYVQNG